MSDDAASWVLGQTSGAGGLGHFLIWIGAFIGIIAVAGLALLAYRKRMLSAQDAASSGSLLDQLRRMHKEGSMTQQEYDAARKAIVSRVAARGPGAPPKPAPAKPDALTAKPGFDLTGAPLPTPPPDTDHRPPSV